MTDKRKRYGTAKLHITGDPDRTLCGKPAGILDVVSDYVEQVSCNTCKKVYLRDHGKEDE